MITTTQDILYITVAICAAVFTGFLVWIMYYLAQISRQSNELITDFRSKLEQLDDTVTDIKTKVTSSFDRLAMISEQVGGIVEFIQSLAKKKKRRD